MFAIAIPLDPDIFQIGAFRFNWHSAFAIVGLLVGVWIAQRLGRRTTIPEDDVMTIALCALGGGIVMARLLFVVDNLHLFTDNWGKVFAFHEGGITVWGAPLGGALGVSLAAWWMKHPVRTAIDIGAPGLIMGMAIGRIGDLINGEHHAKPSNLPWAVYYTHEDTLGQSIPVHPATSYELLGDLIIFAIAVWLATRYIGRLYVFWTVLAGYAAMRFGLQFLRIDQAPRFLDLQQSQIISLLVLLTFGLWLTNCLRTRLWHQKPKA